ncbi:hypothetical protein KXV85_005324, partial [Aspergillus fumigatus]
PASVAMKFRVFAEVCNRTISPADSCRRGVPVSSRKMPGKRTRAPQRILANCHGRDASPRRPIGQRSCTICEADRTFRAVSSGHGSGSKGCRETGRRPKNLPVLQKRHGLYRAAQV